MQFTPLAISLDRIAGISALNARHDTPPDEAIARELAPSIVASGGPIESITLVRESADGVLLAPDAPQASSDQGGVFRVLEGRRRFLALQHAAMAGDIRVDHAIRAQVFAGTEAEAREVSLFGDIKAPLHPALRAQKFRALAADVPVADIARHFGETARGVRQLIALGGAHADVLAAWSAGQVTRESVEAYCVGTPEQQIEIFRKSPGVRNNPAEIRKRLRGEAIESTQGLAIFVGLPAYVAAGGAIDEDLFGETTWLLDAGKLRALAEKKLMDAGAAIRKAEGWGWFKTQFDDGHDALVTSYEDQEDWTDADEARRDEIRAALIKMQRGDPDRAGLEAEQAALESRAWTRGVAAARRKKLGVAVAIDYFGQIEIDRAQETKAQREARLGKPARTPSPAADASPDAGDDEASPLPARGERVAGDSPPGEGRRESINEAAVELLDAAILAATTEILRTRFDVALMKSIYDYAVDGEGENRVENGEPVHPLVARIVARPHMEFHQRNRAAVALIADASREELMACYCAMEADSFGDFADSEDCAPYALLAAARGAPIAEALLRHVDRDAYDAAIAAHGAPPEPYLTILGAGPMSAAEREDQRRSFAHGNAALDNPAVTRSLVDAMADALAADSGENAATQRPDEGQGESSASAAPDAAPIPDLPPPADIEASLALFLLARTRRKKGATLKSRAFADAFTAWHVERGGEPVAMQRIKPLMLARGIEHKRTDVANIWLGIELVEGA